MVALRILFLGLLPCLCFTTPGKSDEKHKRDVKDELIYSYDVVVNATWTRKEVPHLDNKAYITALVEYISDDTISDTLLVGGPKDSGKTKGLVFVLLAARRMGYAVFELNLKRSVDEQSLKRVMEDFSWQFTDFFEDISDSSKLKCVYDVLRDCPTIKTSWHESYTSVIETIMTFISYLFTATALGVIPVYIYKWMINSVQYHRGLWEDMRPWLGFAIIVLMISFLLPPKLLMYKVSYLVHGFKQQVANGDWDVVFCSLNSVESCDILKPILVINDVKKIQGKHLSRLFGVLETKKDDGRGNKPRFPIILEMSDNLWMKGIYSDSSNSSFCFYYLQKMTYTEGKDEMVRKYGLFDDKTYDNLFKIFGGHVRFYSYYWERIQGFSSHEDIMYNLKAQSQITLSACLMGIDTEHEQKETSTLFQKLKNNNFTIREFYLSHVTKKLISCNLLYYNAQMQHLTVQNPLLEILIDEYCSYIASKTEH